jgi:hypothetical protein
MTGDSLFVTVDGSSVTPLDTGAAINDGSSTSPGGGTLTLTNSTLQTTGGTQTFGVYTADGGTTTLGNDTVFVQGDNADAAVESGPHGATTIQGGSISTGGLNSIGLCAHGSGARVTTTLFAGVGTNITTALDNSPGVQADGGGAAQLTGGDNVRQRLARAPYHRQRLHTHRVWRRRHDKRGVRRGHRCVREWPSGGHWGCGDFFRRLHHDV